jgi:hypothetical protein
MLTQLGESAPEASVTDAIGNPVANATVTAFAAANISAHFSWPLVPFGIGRTLSGGDVPKFSVLERAVAVTGMCLHSPIFLSAYCYICVLCPHTAIYVSQYYYMLDILCPHTAIHVSHTTIFSILKRDVAVCVLILLCFCPLILLYI